jgi:Mrp family chromosome partitioning ATPase
LAAAAAAAGLNEPADQLLTQIAVTNGRGALGLSKHTKYVPVKALAVTGTGLSPITAAALANGVANAVDSYLNSQAQGKYSGDLARARRAISSLEAQLAGVDNQIATTSPSGAQLTYLQAQKKVLSGKLLDEVRTQILLGLGGPSPPGYQILRFGSAYPVFPGRATVVSIVGHRSTKILGGALIGLIVALAIVLLVELLDKSIRSPEAGEEAFDLPVVGVIPTRELRRPSLQRAPPEARLDVVTDPASAVAEAYRRLHTAVLLEPLAAELAAPMNGNGQYGNGVNGFGPNNVGGRWAPESLPPNGGYAGGGVEGDDVGANGSSPSRQVVLVVSPGVEPTRGLVVANLAAVYAEAGARALVLNIGNLDWRRRLPAPGATWREGGIEPEDLLPLSTPSPVEGVSRLRFDQVLESRGQVVAQGPAIIGAARQVADVVLVEGPPLLLAHDAVALLPAVDVVLVVAQYGVTRTDDARESSSLLRRFRAPLLGVVLTNVPRKGKDLRRARRELDYHPGPLVVGHEDEPTEPVPVDSAPTARLWL